VNDVSSLRRSETFMHEFTKATVRQRSRLASRAPLADIQAAALSNPDPFERRMLLFFLDHYANDESMAVFAAALHDPVDFVRNIALHSIACEPCKSQALCVTDVVPALIDVAQRDPSPELRMKSIGLLMRLSHEDGRARVAVEKVAREDTDAIVRRAARAALAGQIIQPRKRYQRQQRQHAKLGRRTTA